MTEAQKFAHETGYPEHIPSHLTLGEMTPEQRLEVFKWICQFKITPEGEAAYLAEKARREKKWWKFW